MAIENPQAFSREAFTYFFLIFFFEGEHYDMY